MLKNIFRSLQGQGTRNFKECSKFSSRTHSELKPVSKFIKWHGSDQGLPCLLFKKADKHFVKPTLYLKTDREKCSKF